MTNTTSIYDKEKALRLRPRGFEFVNFDDPCFTRAFLSCFSLNAAATVILGPGGSGKSVILKMIAAHYGRKCLLLAPTGIAAHNIDNPWSAPRTIHAGLGLPVIPYMPMHAMFRKPLEALHDKDVVMIDEISMINAPLIDCIIRHIREANRDRKRKIKLICLGDEYQLQPPFDEAKLRPILKEHPGLFEKWSFMNSGQLMALKPDVYVLETVYRQSNPKFKEVLNHVRMGIPEEEDIKYLNALVKPESDKKALVLAATNKEVDAVNNEHIAELGRNQKPQLFDADFLFGKEITDCGFSQHLELYKGQRVMCTKNLYDEDNSPIFQNGTLGTVVDFKYSEGNMLPVVRADDGRLYPVPYMQFEECTYQKTEDGKYEYLPIARALMIPLRSAYCITYHKAQGLTLDKVHLMVPDHRPQPGMLYLGCSRVRTPDGLSLSSAVTKEMFSLSKEEVRDKIEHVR